MKIIIAFSVSYREGVHTCIGYISRVAFRFLHSRIDNACNAYVEVSKVILMEECNILVLLGITRPNTVAELYLRELVFLASYNRLSETTLISVPQARLGWYHAIITDTRLYSSFLTCIE